MPGSCKWTFFLRFPHLSPLPYVLYVPKKGILKNVEGFLNIRVF
jgi:hypothetical protein